MKKTVILLIINAIWLIQGCRFGAGTVEQNLPDDFFLFANNSIEENSIWYKTGEHSSTIIVEQTVFAVGFNNEYIIAKRHPMDSTNQVNKKVTYYHIIEIEEVSNGNLEKNTPLTKTQYDTMRKKLKLPENLKCDIVFKKVE